MLVMTPRPAQWEPLWGLLLRATEANDYETPAAIFNVAGTEHELYRSFPTLPKLAAVLNCPEVALERIAWVPTDAKTVKPNAVRLGANEILTRALSTQFPSLCPDCVRQTGQVRSSWDMNLMVACTAHGKPLLRHCPDCKRRIRWYRPGLLICSCGAELEGDDAAPVSAPAHDLLRLLEWRLYGDAVLRPKTTHNMAMAELETLSLQGLTTLIEVLGKYAQQANTAADEDQTRVAESNRRVAVVEAAAKTLTGWPTNFHKMMTGLLEINRRKSSASLRGRLLPIYEALFKNPATRGEYTFVRKAFIEFATSDNRGCLVDNRLLKQSGVKQSERRVVSLRELSKVTGCAPRILKDLIDERVIKAECRKTGESVRYLVDLDFVTLPPRDTHGELLSTRKASERTGLPQSVLCGLHDLNILKKVKMRGKQFGFLPAELDKLLQTLTSRAPEIEHASLSMLDGIPLKKLFAMKFYNPRTKPAILAAIAKGEIAPIGRLGDGFADIVVPRADALALARENTSQNTGGTRTVVEAARRLSCGSATILEFTYRGLLERQNTPHGIRITEASLLDFESKFVTMGQVARRLDVGYRAALERCQCLGIQIRTFGFERKTRLRIFGQVHIVSWEDFGAIQESAGAKMIGRESFSAEGMRIWKKV